MARNVYYIRHHIDNNNTADDDRRQRPCSVCVYLRASCTVPMRENDVNETCATEMSLRKMNHTHQHTKCPKRFRRQRAAVENNELYGDHNTHTLFMHSSSSASVCLLCCSLTQIHYNVLALRASHQKFHRNHTLRKIIDFPAGNAIFFR